ncbi:MAG: flagellar biosynthesis anti-sigma factor FlgM [Betaproteobacteria bacterium]|jgi:negative regulator of flagellin synthesis FlgM|nr:flagellar biosynthesis anti-sigma factor FlgM [Betaproteobacteria bacterium]
MKIDSTYKPATSAISPKPATTQSSMPTAAQDEVSLSKLAGTLQSGEHPPINMARIQEIKQAISEGRFKINPEAIADRLIESSRELLNSSKQRQA